MEKIIIQKKRALESEYSMGGYYYSKGNVIGVRPIILILLQ